MKPELFRYGIKQRKCKFGTKIWDWTPDKHYNILKDQIEWIDQTSESEAEST
jgi:aminopeptidase-like protein